MGACCGAPYMDGVFKLKGARYNLKMVDIGKIEPAAKSASANPQLGEVDSDGFDSSVDLDDMRGGRLSTGELLDMDSDESGADLWTPKGRRRSAQKVQDKMHRWMNSLSGRNLGQEVSQEVAVKCRDRTNNMLMLFDLRGSQRHITNYYHKVEFIGEGHYGSVAKWRRNDTPMRQSSTPLSERQENADPDVDTEDDEIEDVGQVVAVKTLTWKRISNSFFRDAKKENNIRNELKMLLMLDHPFIIKFREWFEDPCAGIHFVMEFCDGCSLQKILDDICLLPERAKRMEHMHKLRRYFREIVYAVSYIHGMNPSLVHRDLKPDNVLLKSNSPNSPCKLIDFGLTTWQAESGEGEDYKVGSLHFMAPELFTKGGGRFTEDMDLFALGVMLYWFLTAVHLGELRHPYADREDVLGELQTPTVYITLYNAYRREEAWRSDALEGFSEDAGCTICHMRVRRRRTRRDAKHLAHPRWSPAPRPRLAYQGSVRPLGDIVDTCQRPRSCCLLSASAAKGIDEQHEHLPAAEQARQDHFINSGGSCLRLRRSTLAANLPGPGRGSGRPTFAGGAGPRLSGQRRRSG
eukprot:TRINITY_DN26481_c0_g1_i1.p1 TRINITY_DN26481_c0_g1~~TRINITY_DN26481_c0_g1_i1.p1  ORF type:complete len:577 (+),score=85.31 TRINITY_DN26481_c0_g1_i1:86-1816(+)